MEPESEGHAPPPREDGSENQPTCEHTSENAQPRHATLHVEQRKEARCRQNGDIWTKAVREPNECVAAVDQFFAHIVEEIERTSGKEGHGAEGWIRMPRGTGKYGDDADPQPRQHGPSEESDAKVGKSPVGSA